MQKADFERFHEVMAGMAKMYERELDALLLDAYWLALDDWSLSEFLTATKHLMATSEFMPRPSAFNALRKAGDKVVATEAWAFALKHAVSRAGQPPEQSCRALVEHPLIEQCVIGIGGLRAIWESDADKLHFLERQFHERYSELADVHETRYRLGHVAIPALELQQPFPECAKLKLGTEK